MSSSHKISVRALADFCKNRGDLISTERPSPSLLEGQLAHALTQRVKGESYRAEYPFHFLWQGKTIDLILRGRADGVFETGIEEIKSSRIPPDELTESAKIGHLLQAKLYAGLFALSAQSHEKIDVHLCYVHPQKLTQWLVKHQFRRVELVDYLVSCCTTYENWLLQLSLHQAKRNQFIKQLTFPYQSMRASQRKMAESVYKACATKKHLLVEAPTGTGKSLAALFPALKAMTRTDVRSIYYLSMKTTGQEAALNAVTLLDPKHNIISLNLAPKTRMCLSTETPCDGEFCPYAKDYYEKRNALRYKLFETGNWTTTELKHLGEQHKICPYYLSQDWAIWSDLIIADINYIYDTTATQPYLLKEIDNKATLLIDEAHNLIDRGRMIFSANFSGKLLQTLIREVPPLIRKALVKVQNKLRSDGADKGPELSDQPPESLTFALRDFIAQSATLLHEQSHYEPTENWQNFLFNAGRFVRLHELATTGDFCWRYKKGKPEEREIDIICLNPARLLGVKHQLAHNVIGFSATLKPWPYTQALNGLDQAVTEQLTTPFQREQFKVFICDDVSTRFRDRQGFSQAFIKTVNSIVNNNRNAMIFFSSYQQLKQCSKHLVENEKLFIQSTDWTTEERQRALTAFQNQSGLTLLSVLGGVFAEGIDLPGQKLEQVIIVGPGLPQVNEVNNRIKQSMEQQSLPGFDYAFTFPGLHKVLQAAGRCVRTETDFGEILLVDDRFKHYANQGWLPDYWDINVGSINTWLAANNVD